MSSVKTNIIANYSGSVCSGLMGLVFVPLYIKFMGIESYGLVGFFSTIWSIFSFLDMGLGATLNREMARRSALPGQAQTTRDLLRTLEIIYWPVAVLVGASVIGLAGPIAKYWISSQKLSVADVRQAVMIMGLVLVLRWPFTLYEGGLMGLQKQVTVNILNAISGTFRGLGAVLVLWLISPTIQAFFCWQIIVSGFETLAIAFCLWISLPKADRRSRFQQSVLREIRQFATGVMGINVAAFISNSADKVLLSKMLTLEMYGFYMLAWTLAGALGRLIGPATIAVFPRISQAVVSRNMETLTEFYHKSCQFMSLIVLPIGCVLAVFSYEIFLIWTGNSHIAQQVHLVATLLVLGTACNAMMSIPYWTQLAYGWTSLAFWTNVVSIIVLVPTLVILTHIYGMIAGGIVWALLNHGYFIFAIPIMHGRILKKEMWRWYLYDTGLPFVAALAPALIGKLLFSDASSTTWRIATLSFITLVCYVSVTAVTRDIRHGVIELIRKRFLCLIRFMPGSVIKSSPEVR